MCLTDQQLKRQDLVDNRIFELLDDLSPGSGKAEWDIELIGQIRDSVEDILVERLKLVSEMEFYPYLIDEIRG